MFICHMRTKTGHQFCPYTHFSQPERKCRCYDKIVELLWTQHDRDDQVKTAIFFFHYSYILLRLFVYIWATLMLLTTLLKPKTKNTCKMHRQAKTNKQTRIMKYGSPRQKSKKKVILQLKGWLLKLQLLKYFTWGYLHYRPISRWDLGYNRARCWRWECLLYYNISFWGC